MKHFDLFSGYGGFSLALKRVYEANITISRNRGSRPEHGGSSQGLLQGGALSSVEESSFTTIGFSEIDKYASSVLKYHWPNTKNYGDIKKINWDKVPDFDLLTGGSPCQDLSIAGKRAGLEGERSGLFYEYMRAVREKKPKFFIWENVKGALSSNKGRDFALVLNEMAEAGYSLWWQVLNAKDFGVPQNRERIFVIGFRDGCPREIFFEPGDDRKNLKQIIPGSQGYRTYDPKGISVNIASQAGGLGAKTGLYAIAEATKQGYVIAKEGDSINLSVPNSKTRRGRVGHGIANTLDTGMQQHTLQDARIRRLIPTECERLMGLPDDWLKYGVYEKGNKVEISDSQKYKMAGNGVVINVVEELIKQLII